MKNKHTSLINTNIAKGTTDPRVLLTKVTSFVISKFLHKSGYSWADEILLDSLLESSNSRRDFDENSPKKITTNREKRKVNLVATENCPILCCDENYYSRRDENCPILCCEENSNSCRDEICPILCCDENSNSR